MGTHADKTQETKSQTVVNEVPQMQSADASAFQFDDKRPEAIQLANLQGMVNNSPHVSELKAFQAMASNSHQPAKSAQHVVQRQIDGLVDGIPEGILELANDYNLLGDDTEVGERIGNLSVVEHAVYEWLTKNKAPDMSEVVGATAVRNLMDTTKAERQRIVERSVNESQDGSGEGGLPIAGFENLEEDVQGQVRDLWRGLIEGTGNIQISNIDSDTGEQHDGFKMKVLVEFSRLLEGKFGRSMVTDINTSQHLVLIEPVHLVNKQNKDFAASPVVANLDNLTKLDEPPAVEDAQHYPETEITGMNEEERLKLLNELKPMQDKQLGVRLVDNAVTTYYEFGKGTAVKVTMPSDLSDGSPNKESRLADANRNELATPVFITLGHELGHGIHMQRGTNTQGVTVPNFFGAEDDKKAYKYNQEEYVNIEGNENALREEHGLGIRKGHINIPHLHKERMWQELATWFQWIKGMGALGKLSVYEEINANLKTMDKRIAVEWLNPEELPALMLDFDNLPLEIKTMQFNYLRGNFTKHMYAESDQLILSLHNIHFSFHESFILMIGAIDMELKYITAQAQEALKSNSLAEFLATIPQQRADFAAAKFTPKIDSIQSKINLEGVDGDQALFDQLTKLLNDFVAVSWLFPK